MNKAEIFNQVLKEHSAPVRKGKTIYDQWDIITVDEANGKSNCICTQDIKYDVHIRNIHNGYELIIGSCCQLKIMGDATGKMLQETLKRLNNGKTILEPAIEYLKTINVLTEYEFNFCTDIQRKRKFTEGQQRMRDKVEKKVLRILNYENIKENESITKMIDYVLKKEPENEFFLSLSRQFQRKLELSPKQLIALQRGYNRMVGRERLNRK